MPYFRYFFFSFIFISWRLITSQHCSGFCHTLTWISHGVTSTFLNCIIQMSKLKLQEVDNLPKVTHQTLQESYSDSPAPDPEVPRSLLYHLTCVHINVIYAQISINFNFLVYLALLIMVYILSFRKCTLFFYMPCTIIDAENKW